MEFESFKEVLLYSNTKHLVLTFERGPHGIMANILDRKIIKASSNLLCYYVHFQTNTLGKGMSPFILWGEGVRKRSGIDNGCKTAWTK